MSTHATTTTTTATALARGKATTSPSQAAADEALVRGLEEQGHKAKALTAWAALGRFDHAARVAWELGRVAEAAELACRGGLYCEAGTCFLAAGDAWRAFNSFLRVSPEHPRYRECCVRVVAAAAREDRIDARLDGFLAPWFEGAPRDDVDMGALMELSGLYARHGDATTAQAVLRKVVARDPCFQDARRALDALLGAPVRGARPDEPEAELESEEAFERLYNSGQTTLLHGLNAGATAGDVEPPVYDGTLSKIGLGALVADRYRIVGTLGRGARAFVYRAHDDVLHVDIALKVFEPGLDGDFAEERFRREGQVSRRLAHENLVRVFDTGRMGPYRYITMELLEGKDLKVVLDEHGTFTVQQGVPLLVQLCRGLAYAHGQGLVHRDVKPGNLFVATDGRLKVMDFGIAKHLHAKGLSVSGQFMGTPQYMAPEQITDFAKACFSSDLYAVGVVAYQMFTGTLPFDDSDVMALLMQHLIEQPERPRLRNPTIPPALEAVILRSLAKRPEQRFASATDLADALLAVAGAQGAS